MRRMRTHLTKCIALSLAGFLAACSTPDAVLDLAEKTAANASVLSAKLDELAAHQRRIAEFRARNIAHLNARTRKIGREHAFRVALVRKTSGSATADAAKELNTWTVDAGEILSGDADAEAKEVEGLMAKYEAMDPKSKALASVAKTLAKLAKEESAKDRAKFLAGYFQAVREEVKAKRAVAEAAMKKAKASSSSVKADGESLETEK